MGQKVNPKIFRLGIKKTQWDSRYFEKKKEEFTLYNYQNIEIQSYLKQFFYINGLMLQKTKFHFNETNLYIHISYFSTKKSFFLINKKIPNRDIRLENLLTTNRKPHPLIRKPKRLKKTKRLKKMTVSTSFKYLKNTKTPWWFEFVRKDHQKTMQIHKVNPFFPNGIQLLTASKNILKVKHFLNFPPYHFQKQIIEFQNKLPWYQKTPWYQKALKEKNDFKLERVSILTRYKAFLQRKKYKSKGILKKNVFLEPLLESLSLFTNKKYNIFLSFQNLNRGMSLLLSPMEKESLKKRTLALKRFSKEKFFKDSLSVILIVIKIKNSAKIFSQLIAQQFKFLKRHNFFLTFLRQIIKIFISSKMSKVKGIKICISGRFNGAPRAKSRLITIGDIPIQTINKQIDYHETTSYTKNGTFGIKLWVNYD